MTPRLLIHEQPRTGLEAKFSMPFCAAAAMVFGRVGIETFDAAPLQDSTVRAILPRVSMRANPAFDAAPPLSQARVTITLRGGRTVTHAADGARGYPGRLTEQELADKFASCAARTISPAAAARAWTALQSLEALADVRELTSLLSAD
jgi:2-methylcitrate dehydratase PrpD